MKSIVNVFIFMVVFSITIQKSHSLGLTASFIGVALLSLIVPDKTYEKKVKIEKKIGKKTENFVVVGDKNKVMKDMREDLNKRVQAAKSTSQSKTYLGEYYGEDRGFASEAAVIDNLITPSTEEEDLPVSSKEEALRKDNFIKNDVNFKPLDTSNTTPVTVPVKTKSGSFWFLGRCFN